MKCLELTNNSDHRSDCFDCMCYTMIYSQTNENTPFSTHLSILISSLDHTHSFPNRLSTCPTTFFLVMSDVYEKGIPPIKQDEDKAEMLKKDCLQKNFHHAKDEY